MRAAEETNISGWTLEFSTWMVLAARLWPVWYENRLTLRGAFNSKFSTSSFIEIDFDGLILGMIVFKSSKLGRRFSFPFRVESMFVEFFWWIGHGEIKLVEINP
jgi:hypothetical protein